jgi:class 3 adenylate cyclase/tetratricopeptide (TPR) repeat protein
VMRKHADLQRRYAARKTANASAHDDNGRPGLTRTNRPRRAAFRRYESTTLKHDLRTNRDDNEGVATKQNGPVEVRILPGPPQTAPRDFEQQRENRPARLTCSGMADLEGVAAVRPPSGTVTFLFSDIEGSTQRWARDRSAMQEALRLHDRFMREAIEMHGGFVFKTIGDAFCAAFTTPESAAVAALAAQRALGAADFSAVDGLRVRMAINTGTADERDGDYFGPALNRVARVLSLGYGGQVLLSGIAADLVRENPPPNAMLTELGEYELKNLEGRERVFQLVAPELQRVFPELRAVSAAPWLIPDAIRTRYFTGREDLLARLRQQLVERHRAALSGLGGAGKTQSAIEYAARYCAGYPGGVFWVNAETLGGLTSGFVAIAMALSLPSAESNDQEEVVKSVLAWLKVNDGWLLILDNVDDRRTIRPFVPERGKGDVLITSREPVFSELGVPRALELQDLNIEEGVRFMLARTGREDAGAGDRAAAAELATELGNLPLALEQAAAYIAETNAAFTAYLVAFRKRRVTLLEKSGELLSHDTVAVTWAANFEAVERASPAAADVLRISALLAPDAIPFELFLDGAPLLGHEIAEALADADDLAMLEVLRPLARYSLVRSDATSRVFGVHRLVQEMVLAVLTEADRRAYVDGAVRALDAALPEVEFATWGRCERLIPHVVSLAERVEFDNAPAEAVGRVLNRAGRYLLDRGRGRYAESQALLERAVAILERALGRDHLDVARSLDNLAVALGKQGRYAEAQALIERALLICERALGPDHPDVARRLNNIANIHYEQGRYAEAQQLHERVLAIRERALGPDDPNLAISLNNLGIIEVCRGRYAQAERLYERALAISERALGPDHPNVAQSLDNLGEAHAKQGRYAQAQALFERALEIRECALGPDHSQVAESLNHLGQAHRDQGRYPEAQAMYQRALIIWERELGPDHPDRAYSFNNLGIVLMDQGRFEEAESPFERAIAIRERALGPDHPEVATSLYSMASLRKAQGRNAEAVALYERVLAIKVKTLARDHPEIAELRSSIEAIRSTVAAAESSEIEK